MSTPTVNDRPAPTAASAYLVMGFAGLALIGVHLLQGAAQRWALVPVLIGICGLVFHWRSAPLGVLAAVAFSKVFPIWVYGEAAFRQTTSLLSDAVLCGAVLSYIVAQYRLISLRVAILPNSVQNSLSARDAAGVAARETIGSLFVILGATVGAFFLWQLTQLVRPPWTIMRSQWRVGLLVWILGVALIVIVAVIGYFGWRRQSKLEATLVLRDEFWRQTRGEQRRINRWRAWSRRKRERRGQSTDE